MSVSAADVKKIADTTGTGVQAGVVFQHGRDSRTPFVQVEITATGSLTIEGRADPDAPWVGVTSAISASGITNLNFPTPEVRVNVSANTGTIRVWAVS